ncbi:MAG: histone deacetylase [Spirochaetaceae bacterium]|nr:MAG: histone deacetylase [Spirochaetaceae bacterium]
MILYTPSTRPPLIEYGIDIPSSPDKSKRVLDALRSDPVLSDRVGEWLIGSDGSTIEKADLLRVHSAEYVARLFSPAIADVIVEVFELYGPDGKPHRYNPEAARRPLSEMFDGSLTGVAGTYQCCKEALARGFCFYLGGGAHHGHRDFGHGFCIVNDIVIALRKMQAEGRIRTAWVIDIDAHKGDGTAALTQSDDTIVTVSAHMAHGWPLDEPAERPDGSANPAFIPSDFDVPVDSGEEAEYVPRLAAALELLAQRPKPDLALVVSGADPYERDMLPSTQPLKLTAEQMADRDRVVYEFLMSRSIPSAYLMAGGYGPHAWEPYVPFLTSVLRERLT